MRTKAEHLGIVPGALASDNIRQGLRHYEGYVLLGGVAVVIVAVFNPLAEDTGGGFSVEGAEKFPEVIRQ